MSEGTQFMAKGNADDSRLWGVSMRAWMALLIVVTVCAMSMAGIPVVEPLYSMSLLALGFYFGQKTQTKPQ